MSSSAHTSSAPLAIPRPVGGAGRRVVSRKRGRVRAASTLISAGVRGRGRRSERAFGFRSLRYAGKARRVGPMLRRRVVWLPSPARY
eukprot:330501-Pleurochrysis_carterae.AAC.1